MQFTDEELQRFADAYNSGRRRIKRTLNRTARWDGRDAGTHRVIEKMVEQELLNKSNYCYLQRRTDRRKRIRQHVEQFCPHMKKVGEK